MQETNAAYQACQSERIPPIKVLGSGQPPLNWACEKSKPGFCGEPKEITNYINHRATTKSTMSGTNSSIK